MSKGGSRTGPSHAHYYPVNRGVLGGKRYDTVAYGEDTDPQVGVPKGQLSGELFLEGGTHRGWSKTRCRPLPIPKQGNAITIDDASASLYHSSHEDNCDLG